MFYGASPKVFELAKELRDRLTEPEKILWEKLRLKRLNGYRFKPQHPVAGFIADFYCHKAKLVIEIDGTYHDSKSQSEFDASRTAIINEFGIKIIRFRNEDVIDRIDFVLDEIKRKFVYQSVGPLGNKRVSVGKFYD